MIEKNEFEAFINHPKLEAFVQNNSDFYRRKWTAIYEKTGSFEKINYAPSWNWAAFFLTGAWLFYRKLYFLGCAYWAVIIVWVLAEEFFGDFPQSVNTGITVGFALLIGQFANGFYFQHAHKNLQAIDRASGDISGAEKIIDRHGGTGWLAGILGIVIPLVAIFAVMFIFELF